MPKYFKTVVGACYADKTDGLWVLFPESGNWMRPDRLNGSLLAAPNTLNNTIALGNNGLPAACEVMEADPAVIDKANQIFNTKFMVRDGSLSCQ